MWPTLLRPLRTRDEARRHVGDDDAWRLMVDEPIGHAITDAVSNDLVRGVMATDALIGTFARADDPSLTQNICFLYHLLGGGTGDWDVPIGGMGAVSGALAAAATGHGAEIICGAEVHAIDPDGEVRYRRDGAEHRVHAGHILANVTPTVLAGLLGEPAPAQAPGAQVKVNLMLQRLPRLHDQTVAPEQAFGGTFHINETYRQLDTAFTRADHGVVPDPLPCEIYCHSLTDPTILSDDLRASGAQTLTVFGLHTPHSPDRRGRPRPHAGHVDVRGAQLTELRSGRTYSGCADAGFGGAAVHRGEDDARSGALAGHDGGQHLPRCAVVAVRRG